MSTPLNLEQYQEAFITASAKTVFTQADKPVTEVQFVDSLCAALQTALTNDKLIMAVGNGGSAAIAEHWLTDLGNRFQFRTRGAGNLAELTCMSNDYGYHKAYGQILARNVRPGDIVILISSSGSSANIIHAASEARRQGAFLLTLSGFEQTNPLRQFGDLNVWVPSDNYGVVESCHQFLAHYWCDRFSAASEKEENHERVA